ncbi:LOW QUALITY PROTEIN: hypothetical protein KUTeg_013604 [Tegillarca granosa]|uniref:Uncharacterized protein n=1 Tax=Tegillarca granosa TaxID=220873 RepID=A0ABQ9EZB3_TEGGR|nr:LOW QUALITY PROTEIN: hypothetical protein KUTeg_013604 [Tegillarca granosa]
MSHMARIDQSLSESFKFKQQDARRSLKAGWKEAEKYFSHPLANYSDDEKEVPNALGRDRKRFQRKRQIKDVTLNKLKPIVFDQIKSNKTEIKPATHALQFVFFFSVWFHFAHFSSKTASGHELYLFIWNAVNMLSNFGFIIQYINFSTINPITCVFNNIYSLNYIDISHTIKKETIFQTVSGNTFSHGIFQPFPVHNKLTSKLNFFLTSESKIRNHLAEDVFNDKMLHLMELYECLGEDVVKLNSFVELLLKIQLDARPINASDGRLRETHDFSLN